MAKKPKAKKIVDDLPQQTCARCKGDGIWHSTKTGYRANTAAEPLVDPTRKCPACAGFFL